MPYNTEKIRLAYKSNHNFKHENQVILLMIADGKKWHYLVVKSLSELIREEQQSCWRFLLFKFFSFIQHR